MLFFCVFTHSSHLTFPFSRHRNLLVNSEHRAKISDFGMSRETSETAYYHSKGGQLPVYESVHRWPYFLMPIDCIVKLFVNHIFDVVLNAHIFDVDMVQSQSLECS
jgi:hypothetical protein